MKSERKPQIILKQQTKTIEVAPPLPGSTNWKSRFEVAKEMRKILSAREVHAVQDLEMGNALQRANSGRKNEYCKQ